MKNKLYTLGIVLVLASVLISGCGTGTVEPTTGLANPASVYCEEQGYTLEIRTDENGEYGVCIFPDGSECEEWAFYRGECKQASASTSETGAERPTVVPPATATPVPPTPIPTATNTPVPPTETPLPLSALGQIAFMSNLHLEEREGMQIYVMNADGSNPHRLTSGLGWQGPLSWSPDGKYISSARGGDIWVMDADGSNPRNLTNYGAGDQEPAWSPDGQHIAFSSNRAGRSSGQAYATDIFVMNADGSDPHNLTDSATSDTSPAWSPDGSQIVFQSDRDGNWEIYAMAADGSNPRNLTNSESSYDASPAWSPDGGTIAFDSDRDGDREIYLMDADGSNVRRLTDRQGMDGLPTWSPDGSTIAFQSDRGGESQEICVMEVKSGDVQCLTEHMAFMADWSPLPQ
jgi:Tol biopolymer transport system component/putative hemolysin